MQVVFSQLAGVKTMTKKTLQILAIATLSLTACTQYWGKQGANLQQTAKDLSDCRIQANQGGEKVFTPMELEGPCMAAKGYGLTYDAPKQ